MKTKRIIILSAPFLIAVMCISLTACSSWANLLPKQSNTSENAVSTGTMTNAQTTPSATNTPIPQKKESNPIFIVTRDQYGDEKEFVSREYNGDVLRTQTTSTYNTYIRKEYDEQGRQSVDYNISGEVVGEYRYDEQGRIIYYLTVNSRSWLIYDDQGNEIYNFSLNGGVIAEFSYDSAGRPVSILYTNESANIQLSLLFDYSPDGRHLEVTQEHDGETRNIASVDYDGLGHIIREIDRTFAIETERVWVYNESGMLTEQSSYQGGELSSQTIREYDANGYLIETAGTTFTSDGNYYVVYTSYVRDGDGKILELHRKTVAVDGTESETVETTEYDSMGNPTAKYEYTDSVLTGETVYNSHGDRFAEYDYSSYDGSIREATYYIYDYDDIDPYTVGL